MTARIVAVVFCTMLALPGLLWLAGYRAPDADFIYHSEMRYPFAAPPVTTGALATGGWERDVERQIGDDFPFRRQLIESYDLTKYFALDDVASEHVIRGGGGWLFYADEERRYHDGSGAPSETALARLAGIYAARSAWCRQRGIAYVVAFVPDKSTVYRRFVPASVQYTTDSPTSRLVAAMQARGVRVLDLIPPLATASARGEVYSKGDTHWNDAGAYVAYREIVAALRGAGVRDTIPPSAIRPSVTYADGDLDRLAGISSVVRDAIVTDHFPAHAHSVAAPAFPGDPLMPNFIVTAYETDRPTLPVGILFGDSFTVRLRDFFAEDFRRAVIMQHSNNNGVTFDLAAIEAEHPAVVVQELIERSLFYADRLVP